MVQKLSLNSLAVRREIARLKMLHRIDYDQKILLDSVIPKCSRSADIRFKPIIGRVEAYNNSFVPLITMITMEWNTLPANIVNTDCLVKFSEKLNELTN